MKVTVLQGISGSGKTTYAHKCGTGGFIVSTDFYFYVDGNYVFDHSKLAEAHGRCLKEFIGHLYQAHDVVVDNTNCREIQMAPWVAIANAFNAKLRLVRVECLLSTAIRRAWEGPHKVPKEIVERQYRNLGEYRHPSFWPSTEHVDGMEEDK